MPKSIRLGSEVFDEIPQTAVQASKLLANTWVRLGRPNDPFTDSGKKIMNIIIAIWEDCYPLDAKIWYEERKIYQNNELSTREQVHKGTGRSLASYPYPIFQMIVTTFKGFDPAERKNCMKMVKEWPMFRFANKV